MDSYFKNKLLVKYKQDDKETNENIVNCNVVNIDSKSNNIYYTTSIVNRLVYNPPDPVRSVPKRAELQFTRNVKILSDPNNYRCCITRLSIPSNAIPLFLFSQEVATYTITLSYDPGLTPADIIQETVNVNYIQSNIGDPYEKYQPVYYVQEMLNFVNTAYDIAYNNIVAAVTLAGFNYEPIVAPKIIFNQETKLLELIASDFYENINQYGIFMNKPLFDDFFSGFYSKEVLFGANNFNGIELLVQDFGNNKQEIPLGSGDFFTIMKEEFSSINLFNKTDRIIVSSNMIPVQPQFIATQQDIQLNVLLDFIVPDTNIDRRRLEYDPKIYKWYDLRQQQQLTKFDLKYYILYEDGNVIELWINGNQRIDQTILFVPKGSMYQ